MDGSGKNQSQGGEIQGYHNNPVRDEREQQ